MTDPGAEQPAGLLVCDDLFFTSKVTGTAEALGLKVVEAGSMTAAKERIAAGGIRFAIVDLSLPGLRAADLVAALPADDRPPVLAFDSHVNTARMQAARDAGCDEVLPRSRLSAELPDLLKRLSSPGGPPSSPAAS